MMQAFFECGLFLLSLLLQFADQFKEVKEAARLAREKSQERFELANPALSIAAPEVKCCSNMLNKAVNCPTASSSSKISISYDL